MRLHRQAREPGDRIGDDLVDRRLVVDDAVHKRGVGAVFEKAPHQIGEQILVAADRSVDATRAGRKVGANDLLVKRLAHAVQPLEFPIVAIAGQFEHRGDGMRVVGRELRVERRTGGEKPACGCKIRDIGRDLAGVNRVAVEPALLRPFDLAVPIGAFDEPHHQPALAAPRQFGEPVDQRQCPLLIGLNRESEPVPAGELRGERQPLDEIERKIEPVGLLGVDRQPDPGFPRLFGKRYQPRRQLRQHPLVLRHLVARMQGRQLDRGAGCGLDRAALRRLSDRRDGVLVSSEIAGGVGGGVRRFAQHVERVTIALALGRPRAVERFLDRATHHELARQYAHRRGNRLAHDRLTRARRKAAERGAQIVRGLDAHKPPGQHQRPGRGVDKGRL